MSVQFQVTGPTPIAMLLTTTAATNVVGSADNTTTIDWFQCNEVAGSTPNLTVAVYDGTNTIYLGSGGATWVAKAMTAKQSVEFVNGLTLNRGQYLRITASAANQINVVGMAVQKRL